MIVFDITNGVAAGLSICHEAVPTLLRGFLRKASGSSGPHGVYTTHSALMIDYLLDFVEIAHIKGLLVLRPMTTGEAETYGGHCQFAKQKVLDLVDKAKDIEGVQIMYRLDRLGEVMIE